MIENKRIKKIIRYITTFMLSTYILAFLSPARYDFNNVFRLSIYVILYIFAFYIGANLGAANSSKDVSVSKELSEEALNKCIIALLIYSFIALLYNMAATGTRNLSTAITMSLTNSNDLYFGRKNLEANTIINIITIFGTPIFTIASVYGLLRFKQLRLVYKVFYVISVSFEVLRWMFVGTNKGLFDLVILLVVVLLFFKEREVEYKGGHKRVFRVVIIIIAFWAAISFFSITMQSRLGSRNEILTGIGISNVNYNHFLFRVLPHSMVFGIIRLIDYLTQGYYGLSLGMTLDWQPTFLLGNNLFFRSYLQPLLGVDISERLYQVRVENMYGWGATSRWHTMYLWFANDFSFIGVIIVMLAIGYLLGNSLSCGIKRNNKYALCLSYLLIKAMMYSSANNQILGTYTIVSVFIFLYLWKSKRRIVFKMTRK